MSAIYLSQSVTIALSLSVNVSSVRIFHLGRLPMSWTRPVPSVLYQEGAHRAGDDR